MRFLSLSCMTLQGLLMFLSPTPCRLLFISVREQQAKDGNLAVKESGNFHLTMLMAL